MGELVKVIPDFPSTLWGKEKSPRALPQGDVFSFSDSSDANQLFRNLRRKTSDEVGKTEVLQLRRVPCSREA
jgi:hypothetical protein